MDTIVKHPYISLTALSTTARLAVTLALDKLPLEPFDTSGPTWDTAYFWSIARDGYRHEQQAAFMPALPMLLNETTAPLWGWAASVGAVLCLYRLTLELTRSRRMALTSALLYLIPPSPPTAHSVPYTEPFAAVTTLAGMLLYEEQHNVGAALCWGIGSAFRAQSIVLGVGFFGWRFMLERPWRTGRLHIKSLLDGIPTFVVLSVLAAAPFIAFQTWIYRQFCLGEHERPWCAGSGSSYGWIQSEYWDVGPFRYWTLQQLPNFLLALPVLAMSLAASITFYSHHGPQVLYQTLPFLFTRPPPSMTTSFLNPRLTPYVHLHTALTLVLLISSHVQIILRVCITNPVLWWFVADLLCGGGEREVESKERERRRRWGRWWIGYCIVWGSVAIVLWATFLPPA